MRSNDIRRVIGEREPAVLRTFTPTQLAISRSAGVFRALMERRKMQDEVSLEVAPVLLVVFEQTRHEPRAQ
jgi:hypothetical protein